MTREKALRATVATATCAVALASVLAASASAGAQQPLLTQPSTASRPADPIAAPRNPAGPDPRALVPHLPRGASKLGPMDTSSTIQLEVSLVPAHHEELNQLLQNIYTPGNPQYHQYLTEQQFVQQFGAPQSVVTQVESALSTGGMQVGKVSSNQLAIPVTATVGAAESYFGTSIQQFRLANGRRVFANTSAPTIPESIRPFVGAVVGLDSASVDQPRVVSHVTPPSPSNVAPCNLAGATAFGTNGYTTNSIFAFYHLDNDKTPSSLPTPGMGNSQTVALFDLSMYSATDISTYAGCLGVPGVVSKITKIPVLGGTNIFAPEADLDVEVLISTVPNASIEFYNAPPTEAGQIAEWNQIVADDTAPVVSTSYGFCEPDTDPQLISAENTAFEQAAAQGQSIVSAAGDSGSEDCVPNVGGSSEGTSANTQLAVDDPASQPFVTGVGGTSFNTYITPVSETVWNGGSSSSGAGGAGGGGISTQWPMQPWQQGLGVINSYTSGTPCGASAGNYCREVPDVSALADPKHGYTIFVSGAWVAVGGTSAATPFWASILTLQNQDCAINGEPNTGFANPRLYAAAEAGPRTYLKGIDGTTVPNNNDMTNSNGGAYPVYDPANPATSRFYYSMAAGLGSPDGTFLFNNNNAQTTMTGASEGVLCSTNPTVVGSIMAPIVTTVTPPSGPPSGGTLVTVTGNNFSGVTDVRFGTAPASTFKILNSTTLEAVSPPLALPAGQTSQCVYVTVTEGSLSSTPGAANMCTVAPDKFTYTTGPSVYQVTSVTSSAAANACANLSNGSLTAVPYGPSAGGNTVAICGSGFTGATVVQFFTYSVCVPVSAGSGTPTSTKGCGGSQAQCNAFVPPAASPPASCYLPASAQAGSASGPPTVTTLTGANGQQIQQIVVTAPADTNVTSLVNCDATVAVVTTPAGTSYLYTGSSPPACLPTALQKAGAINTGAVYGFTNLPIVNAISATASPMQGGQPLTVQGFNFLTNTGGTGATACAGNPSILGVAFGSFSVLGTNCRVLSATEIVVDAPLVQYPGTVDIEVVSASSSGVGISPTVPADRFTYVGCSVSYTTRSIIGMGITGSGSGYVVADGSGRSSTCGSALYLGSPDDPFAFNVITQAPSQPTPAFSGCPYAPPSQAGYPSKTKDWIVALAVTPPSRGFPASEGYWEADNTGGVSAFGYVTFFGDTHQINPKQPAGGANSVALTCPIVGMAATSDGGGYWLVGSDGGIYSFGDATFYGSTGGMILKAPIVGMASTPDGEGYWLVASDGGVFTFGPSGGTWSFGDAAFYGSTGALKLNEPIVGMASTPTGAGYWLVGSDGGVFTFGDAGYFGSAYGYTHCFNIDIGGPVVAITSTLDGGGYWLTTQSGMVVPFGDALFEGNVAGGGTTPPILPAGSASCDRS